MSGSPHAMMLPFFNSQAHTVFFYSSIRTVELLDFKNLQNLLRPLTQAEYFHALAQRERSQSSPFALADLEPSAIVHSVKMDLALATCVSICDDMFSTTAN